MPDELEPTESLLGCAPVPDAVAEVSELAGAASLPALPGVLELVDGAGACVLIATTRNIREWVRRRLGGGESESDARRTDLRGVVRRCRGFVAASSLECDAIYLGLARSRLPHAHRVVVERWRPWFVHIDPDAEHPEWSKTNLVGVAMARSASGGRTRSVAPMRSQNLLGPVADKDTAGRLIELAQDGFDLCRYHHLLVQAPSAQACAYKEMGRCPAPCDGSEELGEYRNRVREARDGLDAALRPGIRASIAERMSRLAGSHDFEGAARCKRALDRMEELDRPAFRHATRLATWRMLVLTPTPSAGRVRALLFDRLALSVMLDVDAGVAYRGAVDVLELLGARVAGGSDQCHQGLRLDEPAQDAAAVMSRWLHRPTKKRDGVAISCEPIPDAGTLAKAIRSVARGSWGKDGPIIDDQEIESVERDEPRSRSESGE